MSLGKVKISPRLRCFLVYSWILRMSIRNLFYFVRPETLDITFEDTGWSKLNFYSLPFLNIPLDNKCITYQKISIEIGQYGQEYFPCENHSKMRKREKWAFEWHLYKTFWTNLSLEIVGWIPLQTCSKAQIITF